jgi:hypothetical protein
MATAVATVGAVVVAIFAAVSAERSARAAERQVQHAERMERLRLERDLVIACQRTIASSISVIDTISQLRNTYAELYDLRGERDSAQHQSRDAAVVKRQQSALQLQGEAMELLDRRVKWKNNLDDELFVRLSTIEGYNVQLERALLRLTRDLDKYEGAVREQAHFTR